MKVGDLVKHKSTGKKYLIVEAGDSSRALVGIIRKDGTLGFMSRNWLEVISES
tara:strand:+ start:503 stop:661 length:159 start_codon:yes stop_codon:yes gene_type:complete